MRNDRASVDRAAGRTDRLLFWGLVLSLLFSGCGDSRYTQCEQIFQIAQSINQSNSGSYFDSQQPTEMKNWLDASRMIGEAADRLADLHINDRKLSEYRDKLVIVYRIYSQATYDAVKAREHKSFSALQSAKDEADRAGQIQQDAIEQINAYCVNI
jgi:hypothetical protein